MNNQVWSRGEGRRDSEVRPLRIVVASGKGGTGKTTLATNLAATLAGRGMPVAYVDCDVEEPNGHIFLKPEIAAGRPVSIPVPEVDEGRCTLCGACGTACRYSAIVVLPNKVLTFPKLCHGCGGCLLACREGAIREVPRVTGVAERGAAGAVTFRQGRLDVGEAMAPPVIRAVLSETPSDATVVVDAPPGTSCPVIESIKGADVVVLVSEPTPFGLNDLKLAVEMVRQLAIPFGVAVNRAGSGDDALGVWCGQERIPIVLEVPNDRRIAQAYSRGELAIRALPELEGAFLELHGRLQSLARSGGRAPSEVAREGGGQSPAPEAPFPSELVRLGRPKPVRELVVISGKGGTGKTSVAASFFSLAERAVVVDCDVDAADLHLVLAPTVRQPHSFSGGRTASIDPQRCTSCGTCAELCRFGAIRVPSSGDPSCYEIDPVSCEGCGVCADHCPNRAISMVPSINGEWFVSDTRHGPMVHARLGIAQENSGKLVSLVRKEARAVAQAQGRDLLICDGSPGIGCPVIASISGASMVLIVTEPTLSGLHDLHRVADLCAQFRLKTGVCVNKADINPEMTERIETEAGRRGIPLLGRIRYDDSVTRAQIRGRTVVELDGGPASADVRALWERVSDAIR